MKAKTRNLSLAGIGLAAFAAIGTVLLTTPSGIVNARTGTDYGSDLQAAINASQSGDTLQMNGMIAICNCVENKGLRLQGPGVVKTPNSLPALYYPPGTPAASFDQLEVTTASGPVADIVRHGTSGPEQDTPEEIPQGLTITNSDIHGQPGQEVKRGIAANGANFVIRNSKVREIHGKGYDTQAICGWNGPGPFLIEDNDLQASGENIMFGGADPSIPNLIPSDITIRRNHIWKPLDWKGIWTVKNLFETKNARRVLIDGNLFENVWPDAQVGFAILLKSNNQDSTAPWSVTEDLVFSNNVILNAEHGVNILGTEVPPKVSGVTKRLKLINNFWKVKKIWLQITNGGEDIELSHNTFFSEFGSTGIFGDTGQPTVKGFALKDNIGTRSGYGLKGDAVAEGLATLNMWTPGWTVAGNVLATMNAQDPNASRSYPAGNWYPGSLNEVGFVDLANGNYRLSAGSVYKGKGTDGKDPGVDWDLLNAAQAKPSASPSPSVTPTVTVSPSPTPSPSPSPTGTPSPTPSASPTPTPKPLPTQLPICQSNQFVGNPPTCRCLTGMKGNSGKCR